MHGFPCWPCFFFPRKTKPQMKHLALFCVIVTLVALTQAQNVCITAGTAHYPGCSFIIFIYFCSVLLEFLLCFYLLAPGDAPSGSSTGCNAIWFACLNKGTAFMDGVGVQFGTEQVRGFNSPSPQEIVSLFLFSLSFAAMGGQGKLFISLAFLLRFLLLTGPSPTMQTPSGLVVPPPRASLASRRSTACKSWA